MSFASAQIASSSPLAVRGFLFAVTLVLMLLLLSTGGVGGQTADDHGSTISTATDLPLGSSIEGRIDPADDRDVFRLDLSSASGTTDVWIYATGDLDTAGGLFDRNANRLAVNDDSSIVGRFSGFHIRANLGPGVYYVVVVSYRNLYVGDYTLHAEAVTDPGNTTDTATRLSLDSPTPGSIGTAGNADYFRMEFAESTNVDLYARSTNHEEIDVAVYESGRSEISVNVYPLNVVTSTGTYRHGFWIRDDFGPGTYHVKISAPTGVTDYPVPYTIHAFEDMRYTDFIDECEAKTSQLNAPLISDSLYACQWHLDNLNETDINVEPVWEAGIKGEGINVAIVDDGMYYAHEDLRDNVDASRNHDYTGNEDIYIPFEHHGTHVAGIIAARDNDIGVRGVAPRATVYGYNFLAAERTTSNITDAMSRNVGVTAVSNNSWGPREGPGLDGANAFWRRAIENGVSVGYGGRGTLYAFAGGNGHEEGDNSNLDEYVNHYAVTAVCAVNDRDKRSGFSEMGANLWVCAPSNDQSDLHQGILTTDNSDRYYEEFGETSSSTPIVSGVAALVRSANSDLTWRDVKLILAASARKNDARNTGWQDGARKYGSTSDRYHFNHEYGFGVVDAKAAVDLAKEWRSLPSLKSATPVSNTLNLAIPDAPVVGPPAKVETSLILNTDVKFVEFVEINTSFRHGSFRDLTIELESPSGAVSQLSVPFDTRTDENPSFAYVALNGPFRFGSAKHLGEDPNGAWKLRVTDHIPTVRGTLDSWSIKVYGHESPPSAPTLDSVTAGVGTLTAAWTAPADTGSSQVSSYDLRYIQATADEEVDSNWTVIGDVWNAESVGSLEYAITSLVGGVRYDIQVRAVNRAGAGPWSESVTGTPIPVVSGVCATGGAVAGPGNKPGLVSDCNALLAARDALAGSATLNWSSITPIGEWEGVTVDASPRRVTGLNLYGRNLNGAIPTELGMLSELKRLTLSRNRLTGPVPTWLDDLAHLEELTLWGNRLSGPIPSSLGNLTKLEELYLSQNRLTGQIPATLGDLTSLRELSLWRNELTGPLPAELGGLVNLERLVLSDNDLTGTLPAWLSDLTNLQALSLWGNDLSGPIPQEVGDLPNLEEIYLAQNKLSGPIPSSIGNLANLEVLSLWRNLLTGPIPPELGNLSNLEQLLLRENLLTGPIPESLGNLDNLRRLTLRQNQLDGCVPQGLRDVASNDFDDLSLQFCDVLLESLSISPGKLVQSFNPYRNDYTAMSSATRVTVTPVSEHDAVIEFLDRNRRPIADADTSLEGHQIDLGSGVTAIRVRVTSNDGLSINTYTIAVSRAPSAPSISEVSSGDRQLTVSWTAPHETGGSDLTAYDLRYIRTIADETVDSNWTVLEDVWTPALGGNLEYVIAGLTGSTQYDVQARAVSRVGAGLWSETATSSTAPSICVTGGAVSDATNTWLISDCETLLSVRDTLAGRGSLDWSADIPMTDWQGITLRGSPARVAWLDIRAGGLDGSIPSGLGRLSSLTYLNLRNNSLKGFIPSELGNLTNLRVLGLNNNELRGQIPDLSDLTKLEQLYLSNNDLSGIVPAWLGRMSNVRDLWLWGNELSGAIPDLRGMTSLARLKLQSNKLTGGVPAWFGDMDGLVYLYLYNNPLGGTIPPELGGMSSLRYLWLHTSELTGGIPPELSRLSNLWDLNLHSNRLSGSIPPELGGMTSLTHLRLHRNQLSGEIPSGLGEMDTLRFLWLHGNMLEGAIPAELGRLTSLERLWLSENRLTGQIPAELDGLTKLIQWRLAGNRFAGCVPAGLSEVPNNDLDELGMDVCS